MDDVIRFFNFRVGRGFHFAEMLNLLGPLEGDISILCV